MGTLSRLNVAAPKRSRPARHAAEEADDTDAPAASDALDTSPATSEELARQLADVERRDAQLAADDAAAARELEAAEQRARAALVRDGATDVGAEVLAALERKRRLYAAARSDLAARRARLEQMLQAARAREKDTTALAAERAAIHAIEETDAAVRRAMQTTLEPLFRQLDALGETAQRARVDADAANRRFEGGQLPPAESAVMRQGWRQHPGLLELVTALRAYAAGRPVTYADAYGARRRASAAGDPTAKPIDTTGPAWR